MPPYVAHLFRGEAFSFSVFQSLPKPKVQKASALKDLPYIAAARRPSISNRDTRRLETAVTQRKQTTRRAPNRDKYALFQYVFWTRRSNQPNGHAQRKSCRLLKEPLATAALPKQGPQAPSISNREPNY
jgi:hypothetical protein